MSCVALLGVLPRFPILISEMSAAPDARQDAEQGRVGRGCLSKDVLCGRALRVMKK